MIRLFNTLTRAKEQFKPLKEGHVSLYHCGPTVYDYSHIGNMRSYVFADTLRRMFEYGGYRVKQVINITDVGHLTSDEDEGADKVEEAARREKRTAQEIARFYTNAFFADLKRLNVETRETIFPKASEHIAEQIALLQGLEKRGFTYRTSDGIYFDTSRFPSYGALGKLQKEKLKEGARVEKNPEKKNPTDFALWKFSIQGEKRQQEWDSPWGVGFPGWHLECSAMSMIYLGETFDIHTGGIDHISVHHTNEIAQSEAATGKPFVCYWLHNEFITVEGKKMAKSLGNFFTLSDIMKKGLNPLAYRYWLLTGHYRTSVNFTWDALQGAETALMRLYEQYRELDRTDSGKTSAEYKKKFEEAIHDDLDFPRAIALVWELLKDEVLFPGDKKATLLNFDNVLGLGLSSLEPLILPAEILSLVEERETARKKEDWEKADVLRAEIEKRGYKVKDTPDGSRLTRESRI